MSQTGKTLFSWIVSMLCFLSLVYIIVSTIIVSSWEKNSPVKNLTEERIETIIQYRVKARLAEQVEETLDNRWKDAKDSSNWHEVSYNNTVYLIYSGPGKIVDSWPLVQVEEKK